MTTTTTKKPRTRPAAPEAPPLDAAARQMLDSQAADRVAIEELGAQLMAEAEADGRRVTRTAAELGAADFLHREGRLSEGLSRLVRRAPKAPQRSNLTERQRITGVIETLPDGTVVKATPEERALGGRWRIVHGRVLLGSVAALAPEVLENATVRGSLAFAEMGDEVLLSDGDAARMLDAGVIEALDADPSMVGQCWARPAPAAPSGLAGYHAAYSAAESARRMAAAGPR